MAGEPEQHDVGHGEVNDEHERGGPHLLVEANVSFRLGDGRVDVHEAAESVETAALVAAPHETRQNGSCSKAEQNDTNKEEADAFVVAAPSSRSNVPYGDGEESKPTGQFAVPAYEGHVFQAGREVALETQHTVTQVEDGEHQSKDCSVPCLTRSGQFIGLPVDHKGVVQDTGQCDGPWNWLVLHCESPLRFTLLPIRRPSRRLHRIGWSHQQRQPSRRLER